MVDGMDGEGCIPINFDFSLLIRDLVFEKSFAERREFEIMLVNRSGIKHLTVGEMNKRELKEATVADIVAAYEQAAAAHGPACMKGDIAAANKAYELVNVFSKELSRRGLEAHKALLPLLRSDDPEVRTCAAKDALEFAPDIAQTELEKLIEGKFDCSIHAYLILDAWKNGKFVFPKAR